jgi:hypothetical protein
MAAAATIPAARPSKSAENSARRNVYPYRALPRRGKSDDGVAPGSSISSDREANLFEAAWFSSRTGEEA